MLRFLCALSDAATKDGAENGLGLARAAVARYDACELDRWRAALELVDHLPAP
jgi:hypothetical protein